MRTIWSIGGVVLAALVLAGPIAADDKADELKKLQGTWIIEKLVDPGGEATQLIGGKFTIDGNKYKVRDKKGEEIGFFSGVGTFTIDPKKSPKHIDLTYPDLVGDATSPGIYELDGDTLKICATHSDMRPSKFDAPKNGGRDLIILKRAK